MLSYKIAFLTVVLLSFSTVIAELTFAEYEYIPCTLGVGTECDALVSQGHSDVCCANITVSYANGTTAENDVCWSFLLFTQNAFIREDDGSNVQI